MPDNLRRLAVQARRDGDFPQEGSRADERGYGEICRALHKRPRAG
jgi:hypothetical protein